MKKIFLALIVLIASSANALATTVTVSAYQLQNLPFNPSNVGSDRSITVSATNGSATVTSSAQFPSNIVGIGGFQVAIGGTQYVVSSVASTSTLTLTTNYAGITGSATMTLYKYVMLRAYATAGFQDNVTGQNIQPGTPGSGQFYKQVAVSIINSGSGNVAYLPEFTISSTTDALINNQARYVFGFYRTDGSLLSFYLCGSVQQLALQPNTPTTWTAICNFNSPNGVVPPNNDVYTAAQIDQRFPNCSSGQLYYFAANGNIVSCLSLGTNLSITAGTLNAAGGGGGGPINAGLTGNLAGYAANGTTLSPFTVGAQLTVSGTTLKGSNLRGALNVVVDYGCAGNGIANDTTCISNAISAASAAGIKEVYLPAGTYLVTGVSLVDNVNLVGDGYSKTIISSVSNAPIVTVPSTAFNVTMRGITVRGSVTAGSSQIGINLAGTSTYWEVFLENVQILDTGGIGLFVKEPFSSSFNKIHISNTNGYALVYDGTNRPTNYFRDIYVHTLRSAAPIAYFIKGGQFNCENCNGVDNYITNSVWARIGRKAGFDGDVTNEAAYANWTVANAEAWEAVGFDHVSDSMSTFTSSTIIGRVDLAPGIKIPIRYEMILANDPAYANKGTIDDKTVFADGPITTYANNQAVHANYAPPLMLAGEGAAIAGGQPLDTYYDSTLGISSKLVRSGAFVKPQTITTTTSINWPGVRLIEVSCATSCTINIPWAGWYRNAREEVIIKDVLGTAGTQNIIIQANSGSTINGTSSFIMNVNGQTLRLMPNGDTSLPDWRILDVGQVAAAVTGTGTTNYFPFFDSANSITASGSPLSKFSTSLLTTGSILFSPDNSLSIGGTSDNRPVTVNVSGSVIVPRVTVGNGSASMTSGSATPEAAITAEPGSIYLRTNGNWYIKSSGSGNTGWTLVGIGSGTVTSVAQSFTGGLISVAGSPVTSTGTLALTVAGTSGGIPYFSSASTWASSAALTANLPVIGGGAGSAPTVGTRSGNTTAFVTTTGAQTSGNCVSIDASGNHIASGATCGAGTVNSGTQYQMGYYATTAAALSGNSGITTSATNTLTIAPTAASSGTAPVAFQVTGAAHTGLSASSEVVDINFALNRTVQRAAGGVTTDRSVRFQGRTVSFAGASTVTNEYNVEIESNTAGTNATLTASTALHTFPSVTTHHGIFADHQVGATGDSLRVGLSGSPIVRFNASGGTINSVFNANGALSTSATDGFQYISQIDSATNPTGVPTSYSGSSAIVLQNNTTNAQYVMKSYLNSGWRDLSQSLGHTTPAQITATQNNYNPGAVTRLQRWSSDTSRQVTGLTFTPTQMSGQEHIICNVGTNDIVLVHESASSTSTNRFATTSVANITIVGESCATVIYDGVTQRWRAWVNP